MQSQIRLRSDIEARNGNHKQQGNDESKQCVDFNQSNGNHRFGEVFLVLRGHRDTGNSRFSLRKRGELDSLPELQAFADRLEKATLDTINSGIMTKDLALLYDGEAKAVNSREFLASIRERLEQQ